MDCDENFLAPSQMIVCKNFIYIYKVGGVLDEVKGVNVQWGK